MSKKDFIALADALRDIRPPQPDHGFMVVEVERQNARLDQWNDTVKRLAMLCAESNPQFKREGWIAYINGECEPNGGAVKGAK